MRRSYFAAKTGSRPGERSGDADDAPSWLGVLADDALANSRAGEAAISLCGASVLAWALLHRRKTRVAPPRARHVLLGPARGRRTCATASPVQTASRDTSAACPDSVWSS